MPGVKSMGVIFVSQIDRDEWERGKQRENEDLYLRRLRAKAERQSV